MNQLSYFILKTKLGHMAIVTDLDTILKVYLPYKNLSKLNLDLKNNFYHAQYKPPSKNLSKLINKFKMHMEGSIQSYDEFKIDLGNLTEFQKSVLYQTKKIKVKKTLTYKDLASKIGKPNSYRAVGGALSKNPVPLIIPCHRVIAKSGLGGFTADSGIKLKRILLEMECRYL